MNFSCSLDTASNIIIDHTAYEILVVGLAAKLASINNNILDVSCKENYNKYIVEASNRLHEILLAKILKD